MIDRVAMEEDQTAGQLIVTYAVDVMLVGQSTWAPFSKGTTIGSKRIDRVAAPQQVLQARLTIVSAFAQISGVAFNVFAANPCKVALE